MTELDRRDPLPQRASCVVRRPSGVHGAGIDQQSMNGPATAVGSLGHGAKGVAPGLPVTGEARDGGDRLRRGLGQ